MTTQHEKAAAAHEKARTDAQQDAACRASERAFRLSVAANDKSPKAQEARDAADEASYHAEWSGNGEAAEHHKKAAAAHRAA